MMHICAIVFAFGATVFAAYMVIGQCLERWGL